MKKAPSPHTDTQGRSGRGEVRASTRRRRNPSGRSHRADERIWPLRVAELDQPIVMNADIAHQNGVVGQRLSIS